MYRIWAFFYRDLLNEISYRLSFFLEILSIAPVILMFFFLSRLFGGLISEPLAPYGGNYFPFVLIGIAFQNYFNLSLSSISRSLRDSQVTGTLEIILAAPLRIHHLLIGTTLYSFIFNSLRIFIYFFIGSLFFQVDFAWGQILSVLPVLFLTIGAFMSLGIFSASFIILFKRGDPLTWAFSVSAWLFGGVYYPVNVLPSWVQKISLFIPMTHALEAMRMVFLQGRNLSDVSEHLLVLGLWVGIGLPLSVLLFRFCLKQAREKGTLGHY